MKLLFDENLSPELVWLLADLFPESVHVRDVGLKAADDPLVWQYAKDNLLIIVSKDSDLHQRSFMFGHPPKLVWVFDWAIAPHLTWKDCYAEGSLRSPFFMKTVKRRFWPCLSNPVDGDRLL